MDHQRHEPVRFWYYYDFSPLRPGHYYCGDCFRLLPAIESGTVDMVLIDPPYYMGKDKAWDCFEGRADYMAFMGRAFIQAQRILKENGTLGFWHNDLQKITWLCDWLERNTDMRFATWGIWVKPNHRRKIWVNPGPGNTLRSWFNIGEFCVFFVKGTAGTAWNKTGLELAKLNTENFGSLRDYFRRLLEYTDVTKRQIIETVGQSADHCFRFGSTQWLLPTRETYLKIVAAFHCDSWEGYRTFESLDACCCTLGTMRGKSTAFGAITPAAPPRHSSVITGLRWMGYSASGRRRVSGRSLLPESCPSSPKAPRRRVAVRTGGRISGISSVRNSGAPVAVVVGSRWNHRNPWYVPWTKSGIGWVCRFPLWMAAVPAFGVRRTMRRSAVWPILSICMGWRPICTVPQVRRR